MRPLVYLFLFLFPQLCFAQFVEKTSLFISPTKSVETELSFLEFELDKSISSVSIEILDQNVFDHSFITSLTDTFLIVRDEHGPSLGKKFSNLIIFPSPIDYFQFHYSSIRDSVMIYLINDKTEEPEMPRSIFRKESAHSTNFEMPVMIDQSVWREGLNEPHFERIVHDVHNVIVHHSASSNLVTDYTTAIRNIYLYHTGVRGWSDIGYNYLIVPNGDIYKGRDPGIFKQDLVMGAHFCSSNRGTMGICMLGTFTDVAPTDTAFDSLEKLLVWKLGKDGMHALGQYPHPLDPELNVISGHRDGCATECPGEVMYSRLGLMRDRVHNKIIILGIDLFGFETLNNENIHLYPNPVDNQLIVTSSIHIESISVLTIEGRLVKEINNPFEEINLSNLQRGTYILAIKSGDQKYIRKIVKK